MPRSPARQRPTVRITGYNRWLGQGPQVQDAVTGWQVPEKDTVVQRGVRVSRDYKDGARDREDDY